MRAESPLSHESGKRRLRNAVLRYGLFRLVDRFLYIGTENRLFYKHFGVQDDRLVFTPYSVDNQRFRDEATKLLPQKKDLRRQIGLPEDAFIVLFSGKYISKKRPLDLLKAISRLQTTPGVAAVFVGEGMLRSEMEHYIHGHHLQKRAFLTGFVNQSAIPQYYAIADAFVMCSEKGETWGLSTNEAMNFGLPVLLSDQTGCASDLVENGNNGFVFRCSDIAELSDKIATLAAMSASERARWGDASLAIISRYSYQAVIAGLQKI